MSERVSAMQRQRGVTLVELMVALTISAILTAGAIQIFRSARGAYHNNEALARVQENGRFAVQFLADDIRSNAAASGCAERANVNSTLNGAPGINFTGAAVQGADGGAGPGINVIPHTGPSDSFTLRGSTSQVQLNLQNNMPNTAAAIPVNASPNVNVGSILMITDCTNADVFQVTNFNGTALVHNAGSPPPAPGNSTQMLSQSYTQAAQVLQAFQITYQLQLDGDGNPQLVRIRNGSSPEPLVDGVVDMQIVYGEDTDNDDVPNAYLRADQVGNWGRVLAIRARLTVRSEQQNVSPNPANLDFDGDGATETAPDNRLYEIFTVTNSIRNRLP